jgi:hypothetical protein
MANQLVKRFVYNGGTESFTVPAGFKPEVDVYLWGAGGGAGGVDGNGPAGNGGGGWHYNNTVTLAAGDTVLVAVGGPGGGGGSSSGGGGGSAGPAYTATTAWSTLDIQNSPNNLRVTNGAYVGFLNQYGIWNYNSSYGTFDQTVTVNFSTGGYFTITGACDNYATIYVDGAEVLSIPGFQSTYSNTFYVTPGNHSVRLLGVNTGGPASLGVTINGSLTGGRGGNAGPRGWSGGGGGGGGATLLLINGTTAYVAAGGGGGGGGSNNRGASSANNPTSITPGNPTGGDCPGDGGGGGGGGGGMGAGGAPGFDNAYGGLAGSAGSSSSGAVGANGSSAGGSGSAYWAGGVAQGGQGAGASGSPGQAVLVFSGGGAGRVKVSGVWKPVNTLAVKVDDAWRSVRSAWVKQQGEWKLMPSIGAPSSITTTFSRNNFG